MSIEITNLRPGVLTLVQSNPKKYDPNGNGEIDDGEELAQLMAEYGISDEHDLMHKIPGVSFRHNDSQIYTSEEQLAINKRTNVLEKNVWFATGAILGGVGAIVGALVSAAEPDGADALPPILKQSKVAQKLGKGLTGALLGLTIPLVIGTVASIVRHVSAKKQATRELKAEQAQQAIQYRQDIAAQQEKARKEEEARNQANLQYRQDMASATDKTNNNMTQIQRKTKEINKELDKTKKAIEENNKQEQKTNSVTE